MLAITSKFHLHTNCSKFPKKAHEKEINTEELKHEARKAREAQGHVRHKACEAPGHEGHGAC